MSLGYYFDMTRCVGCRACQLACKDKNRLEIGIVFRNAKTYSVGSYPNTKMYSFSASCNHCATPACQVVCPTGAIFRSDDGMVILDKELCIGISCGACISACPYENPQALPDGTAIKCDSCYAIRQAGGLPSCVANCPDRALDFGDLEDLKRKYGSGLVSEIAVLPPKETTLPSLLIKARDAALSKDFIEVDW